jgi:predicted XRE-type DNA-binding protein
VTRHSFGFQTRFTPKTRYVIGEERESMTKEPRVRPSSGNVFADLRIPNPQQYLAKAELAANILQIVERRGITQAAAGKLLGITQPKVSALLNGRLDGFSSDRLFRFLNALGCDIQIVISRPRARSPGNLRVKAG